MFLYHSLSVLNLYIGAYKFINVSFKPQTFFQVIKMLVCVILLYVICWSPVLVLNLIAAFVEDWRKNYTPSLKYTREAFFLLSYLNSCVNPIVYGFMSKNFRQSFKQTICACCEKRKYSRRYTIERQTTTYMSTTMSRMDSTMTSPKAEESGSPSKDNHVTSGPVSVWRSRKEW